MQEITSQQLREAELARISVRDRVKEYIRISNMIGESLCRPDALEADNMAQTTEALRKEFHALIARGYRTPVVANLNNAVSGNPRSLKTLADIMEVTFDMLFAQGGASRGNRYKDDEFVSFLRRAGIDKPFDLEDAKKELNLHTRQLGGFLSALGSLALSPAQRKETLVSLIVDDLLKGYGHILNRTKTKYSFIPTYLAQIGLDGARLVEHFLHRHREDICANDARWHHFLDLVNELNLADDAFLEAVDHARTVCQLKQTQPREFRADETGSWEQKVISGNGRGAFTAWVPYNLSSP